MSKLIILIIIVLNQKSITPKASYYSDSFVGKITASGEKFDQDKLTAASPYLMFGKIVKVTNLDNDKFVLVRINDRGPYKKNSLGKYRPHPERALDLSKKAFMQIADTCIGIINIKYELLN